MPLRTALLLLALCVFVLPAALADGANAGENGAPAPGDPPKDGPAPTDEPGEAPKDPPPAPPEDEEEENPFGPQPPKEAPAPDDDPADPVQPDLPAPPEPGPTGMVYAPPGKATFGTTAEDLSKLVQNRDEGTKLIISFEYPPYEKELGGFFLDATEVTNAQYEVFLKDTSAGSYDTAKGGLPHLLAIAGFLLGTPKDVLERDDVAWRQLYHANRPALWDAMPTVIVKRGDGTVDEAKTEEAFRRAPLAKGIVLEYYTRRPPADWPGLASDPAERNRPVRWVSYNDSEAFAEWAGKHIPTEEEWEWAARGPDRRVFPWGKKWYKSTKRCNWGGQITETESKDPRKAYKPRTVDVDDPAFAAGRSWIGAWHMLGNVAEWTSTWFNPYPKAPPSRTHANTGTYVKVIRGGSLIDQDTLALRAASRNFVGGGPEAPPKPENRFEFVGFRCAWYLEPGRDLALPTLRRAIRGRRFTEADFATERATGAVAAHYAAPPVVDGVTVTGRARGLVVVPLRSVLSAQETEKKIRNLGHLLELSEGEDAVALAALHTDVPLEKVWVKAPPKPDEKPSGGRRRTKSEAPELVAGKCPPGTYIVAVRHRRLCLASPELEVKCFLTEELDKKKMVEVKTLKADEAFPPSLMAVDPDSDFVQFRFGIPVGGAKTDEGLTLIVGASIEPAPGALAKAGEWRTR